MTLKRAFLWTFWGGLVLFAIVAGVLGTVCLAAWLAFRHRHSGDVPSWGRRYRRFDMDSYLSAMERRLRNLETVALRHAGRY